MISVIKRSDVRNSLPSFGRDIHKGDRGKVLVIGGSRGMIGAAIFSAKSALNCGSGLVYLAVPFRQMTAVNINNPELLALPIYWGYIPLVKKNRFDAIVIGPGLRINFFTKRWVKELLLFLSYHFPGQKILIDAGALSVLKSISRPLKLDLVITPHLKEMSKMTMTPLKKIKENPWAISAQASKRYQATVVLKSHQTMITRNNHRYLNKNGTQALARGGSGDVLSGIISSLMAQGLIGLQAAICGTYLHGLAGQIAAEKKSIDSVLPADIIKSIPSALKLMKGN